MSADDPDAKGPEGEEPEGEPLHGISHAGGVVRIGDTVRRPVLPQTPAITALLEHLQRKGFDGAPRPLGIDERGRAMLSWVEGDVGMPPYPAWVADDDLLASVAMVQRRFHDAVRDFAPPAGAVWSTTLASPHLPDDAIVGHNDLSVENVVVRDGRAVAFIDVDFAAPTDPLWDVAVAVRHWVPVRDPADLDDARREVDQVARFVRYCDTYGLDAVRRGRVVEHCATFLRRALEAMRVRAEQGLPGYVAQWEAGYEGLNLRAQDWLHRNGSRLAAP